MVEYVVGGINSGILTDASVTYVTMRLSTGDRSVRTAEVQPSCVCNGGVSRGWFQEGARVGLTCDTVTRFTGNP